MSYKGFSSMYGNQSDPNSPFYIAAAYGSYVPPNVFNNQPNINQLRGIQEANLSKTNLYIKGLPPMTTDMDLRQMCQSYGKIVSSKAIIDQMQHICKGYGFVEFESAQVAYAALVDLTRRGVQVQMAKAPEYDTTNLYISNLPHRIDESDLSNMLSPFGRVVSTRILRNDNKLSRGVGFARLESEEVCEKIIETFHGKLLPGHPEPLVVKFAGGGHKKRDRNFGDGEKVWDSQIEQH